MYILYKKKLNFSSVWCIFYTICLCILTCGKSFKSPNVNIAIAVDVAVQNCIFKNVTEHL